MTTTDPISETPKELRLEVPFLLNNKLDCGPICLAMGASYFGLDISMEEIQELALSETSGVTWTLGLAAAASQMGLLVRFYSQNLGANPANFDLEYYREHTSGLSETQLKLTTLANRCLQAGGVLEERSLSFEELRAFVEAKSLPIVLLDWAKVTGVKNKYIGHFVPVVGFLGTQVLIHNPGPQDATAFLPIERDIFESARKATGTDEDVLILEGLRK